MQKQFLRYGYIRYGYKVNHLKEYGLYMHGATIVVKMCSLKQITQTIIELTPTMLTNVRLTLVNRKQFME